MHQNHPAVPDAPAATDAADAQADRVASLTEPEMFCIDMLGKGYDAKAVANASGIAIDKVRDLAEEFMPAIVEVRVAAQATEMALQDKAFAVEATALSRLESFLTMETDSMKLMRIYNTMRNQNDKIRMERKGMVAAGNTVIHANIVQLAVPAALARKQEFRDSITMDSASRVVAIGDRPIASASKAMIDNLANTMAVVGHPISIEDFAND